MVKGRKIQMILIWIFFLSFLHACSQKDNYPHLIEEEYNPTDKERDSLSKYTYYSQYKDYKTVTTKYYKNKEHPFNYLAPWEFINKDIITKIFSDIEHSIKASINNGYNISGRPASMSIKLTVEVEFPEYDKELEKRENNIPYMLSALDFVTVPDPDYKISIPNYKLINEKNESVMLEPRGSFVNILTHDLNSENKKHHYNLLICSEGIELDKEYYTLTGFMEIELEAPIEFEKIKVTPNDVGKIIKVNGKTIQILVFENNVFHYKFLNEEDNRNDFKIYFNNCKLEDIDGYAQLPEKYYNFFRKNPLYSYSDFEKELIQKFNLNETEVGDGYDEFSYNVYVYKLNKKEIDSVTFYYSKPSQKMKKRFKIPINLKFH